MKYGETGVPCTFYKKGLWFAPKVKVNNTQNKRKKNMYANDNVKIL
jgi:hypothetical protein